MEEESVQEAAVSGKVPWTARDAWLGVWSLGAWIVLALAVATVLNAANVEIEPGLAITLGEALLLIPVWWLTIRKYDVGWETLGLRGYRKEALRLGFALLGLFYILNIVYSSVLKLLDVQGVMDLTPMFSQSSSPWLIFVGGIVVAPVVEEIFFRGFVFTGLRERFGWKWAGAISAALFSLIHLQPVNLLPIFGLGYAFAYLYQRYDSLWPPIIVHAAVNTIGLVIFYLGMEMGIVG